MSLENTNILEAAAAIRAAHDNLWEEVKLCRSCEVPAMFIRAAHDDLWEEIKQLRDCFTPSTVASRGATIRARANALRVLSQRLEEGVLASSPLFSRATALASACQRLADYLKELE
jgi:hypothetical protein